MDAKSPVIKLVKVDADLFESVAYVDSTRQLFVKLRKSPAMCFNDMPRFRFNGLLGAPRKDAYFTTYIKDKFLAKEVTLPTPM